MASSPHYTGAILAGGQSSRMGQPKEGVVLSDGRRMIEHLILPLSQVCHQIVIVGTCRGFSIPPQSGLLHLHDTTPGMGPLAAINTLLQSGIDPNGYLVTACDQPFLTPELFRLLVADPSSLPRILKPDEMLLPFPGYYPVTWRHKIEEALQEGERSICRLIEKTQVDYVAFPGEWKMDLRNINTPGDLERAS
jgi:molybdopterin-guanine dinucleotide biosynthesis protein A